MWSEGELVVWRNVWRRQIRHAMAMYVVEDTSERYVLYVPAGTPSVRPEPRGVHPEWQVAADRIDEPGLFVHRRGDRHTARLWSSKEWYCNVEEQIGQTPLGIDVRDLVLDVLIDEHGTVRLKDEDELSDGVATGLLSAEEAACAREEAARVVELWDRGEGAFGEGWEQWRPPPTWKPVPLPEGWDVV